MEYLQEQNDIQDVGTIPCCECGISIEPNAANTCAACLRMRIGIADGIPKQYIMYFCRNCERYLQPPNSWVKATLESRELLGLCLKKVKGIDKTVRLVDAGFVWTEPHSKRIKVKITIQKEVMQGVVLQEKMLIEYVINNQMCEDCHRVEAKDYWKACVQIRQKTQHKKTLYYMEQMILKHKAHSACSNVKQVHEGLDFYYQHPQDSRKLVEFLQSVVPCKSLSAKELISHDIRSNTYNYKSTSSVEIVPLCKDDAVCLPQALARQLGDIGQICLVYRITSMIYVIDPNTCKSSVLRGDVYWRNPFTSFSMPKQLTEFIVMHAEVIDNRAQRNRKGQGTESEKHILGEAWVVRSNELGTDNQYYCRTHLGHLLKPGDTVLGYDLKNMNFNDDNLDKINPENIPDVILVKKTFGDAAKRSKKRAWKLNRLPREDAGSVEGGDFNDFMNDLEEDQLYRQNINIYRDHNVPLNYDTDNEDLPVVDLSEMLEDLHVGDDATGCDGDLMQD